MLYITNECIENIENRDEQETLKVILHVILHVTMSGLCGSASSWRWMSTISSLVTQFG